MSTINYSRGVVGSRGDKKCKGFTLVELLVVISIIALLLSILMPALNKVRTQAMVVMCAANCKQIGTLIAVYQAENEGCVPVIFSNAMGAPAQARNNLISVALRSYSPQTKNLPIKFDPGSVTWTHDPASLLQYYRKYLPKFYVCPFVRGKAAMNMQPGASVRLGTKTYQTYVYNGTWEPYSTSMSQYAEGGIGLTGGAIRYCQSVPHPLGPPNGIPKFGMFPWYDYDWMDSRGWNANDYIISKDRNIRWKVKGTGKPSSLAMGVALWCQQGQWDVWAGSGGFYMNYGSHKRGNMGGTNAILGDTHVEWVPGTQIGW